MTMAFFLSASGVPSLNLYSTEIFVKIKEQGEIINVNKYTTYVGLAQLAGAFLAPLFSTKIPYRCLIIAG